MASFYYHIYFRTVNKTGITSEYTRLINCPYQIEYSSDIEDVQAWAAREVKADKVMLINWTELKGEIRPRNNE